MYVNGVKTESEEEQKYKDKVLSAGGETDPIEIMGRCDIIIEGLTAGTVQLQHLLPATEELPNPQWTAHPEGSWDSDAWDTLFISGNGAKFKLVGIANNADVYVKLWYFLR